MEWHVVASTSKGTNHQRMGTPNQDAVAARPSAGSSLAVAVSDGHGSPKCFRSDAGAQLAVDLTVQLLLEFNGRQTEGISLVDIRAASTGLAEQLVRLWRDAVTASLEANRLSAEELGVLEEKAGVSARQAVEENPLLAYGATVLGALVSDAFVLYLQLGDGDILTVSDNGEVTRPLPADDRLFGNETTSLCQSEAWRAARVDLRTLTVFPPALILLSTDGYSNSYGEDAHFLKIGSDYLEIIHSQGLNVVEEHLEAWLAETSSGGSGDDITLAMICRHDFAGVPDEPH
jgi:serine/threonine protein phosphatase PrpC